MFYPTRNQTSDEAHSMTIDRKVPQALLDRLGPKNGNPEGGRTWRFSERMARVYQQQMDRFDDDEETRQWRRLYSVDNMLPPRRMTHSLCPRWQRRWPSTSRLTSSNSKRQPLSNCWSGNPDRHGSAPIRSVRRTSR